MDDSSQPSLSAGYTQRFSRYFDREVARKAAHSLSDGSEMEFRVDSETFTFTKAAGKNAIESRPAKAPQLVFTLTPAAADAILDDPSNDIGTIGVHIAKMIAVPTPDKKITVQFKAGFLSLFSKGYLGVVTSGGSQFASFLASKGLHGMSAIKDTLKKMKG